MSEHHIDRCTVAITCPANEITKQPWIRVVDCSTGKSVLVSDEAAIRNLRAACDAALGEEKMNETDDMAAN